ncbi:hypothetical protein Mapa_006689 [Marchantia paleacea]|nr:hypothetical protein Mapa_006689 [Marchantia paleacea]
MSVWMLANINSGLPASNTITKQTKLTLMHQRTEIKGNNFCQQTLPSHRNQEERSCQSDAFQIFLTTQGP